MQSSGSTARFWPTSLLRKNAGADGTGLENALIVQKGSQQKTKYVLDAQNVTMTPGREENAKSSTGKDVAMRRKDVAMRLNDDDRMPFGKHQGRRLGEVPDTYWLWFLSQDWCDEWPDLVEYANLCVGE